jgi:hypothetical protein
VENQCLTSLHPSQFQAVGGKPLKREGAIANINAVGGKKLNKEGAIADINRPDMSTIPDSSTTRAVPDNNIR